ncbi:MAG: 16S rRNA (guanine(527)-N(7))-methyltransferase RsmG [Gammaproteobacteria bacterium]
MKKHDQQDSLIEIYVEEILKFNKAHNIVGRNTKEEIYAQDIVDCRMALKHIPPEKEILDIGSGAGLPGLLIAILRPRSYITMSEKNQKKAYFIKKTIHTLGLTNAEIKNKAISSKTTTNKLFDVITARALAPTPKIINWSAHLLAKSGKYVLMKGTLEKIKEEVAQLDNNTYSYNIHKTNIKNKHRHILEITKK